MTQGAIVMRFSLNAADLRAAQRVVLQTVTSKRTPWIFLVLALAGGAAMGIGYSALGTVIPGGSRASDFLILGLGVLVGLGLWTVQWWLQSRMQAALALKLEARRGGVEVRFGPGGLSFASACGRAEMAWRAIDAIMTLPAQTALRSGARVFVFPDRALAEGITPEGFRETLRQWHAGALP